ncbi:molybdopterin-dependent oxidoreductase [Cryptosporangium phraense]|uniref:molybdopterin-dependent oxidoreductase n=1 Tax=Cryptosporangium phraense TaxID=2593070 RepID=UPI00197AF6BD|nr:molybdopterin-dependent oxidoreductase [Cryptosporangium phraense]
MRTRSWALPALAGVAAAASALGVAEVVAAFVGPSSSPVTAVSGAIVDRIPRSLEQFGVQTLGHWDKPVLTVIILVVLAGIAVAAGILARRRVAFGLLVFVAFAVIGVLATASRPDSTTMAVWPTVVGAGVGMAVLSLLVPRALAVEDSVRAAEPADVGGAAGSASAAATTPAAVRAGAPVAPPPLPTLGGGAGSRRSFLYLAAGTTAAAAVVGGGGRLIGRWRGVSEERAAITLPKPADPAPPLPAGAKLDAEGVSPLFTPNSDFYRVDTAFVLPQVNPKNYKLRIHGRVAREMEFTYQDLLDRPLVERDVTLTCVSNDVGGDLVGNARWLGVRLKDLLDEVEPDPDADQLVGRSADGWTCGTPTAACRDGRDALIAVGMNGEPLPVAHGFPVRMVVPGLYGYVSATKWLVDLELSRFSDFDAYWVPRGWAQQAPIKVASRIDTPRAGAKVSDTVTVAGVAWAQHVGIAKVELKVDDGPWQQATLAAQDSIDTWRQWRWDWKPSGSGDHVISVRATNADGVTQPEQYEPPAPDGSQGWHSVDVTVR